GGEIRIRGDVSSQFLSALLMALPLARESESRSTTVTLTTPLVSRPYVAMTVNLMQRFGVVVDLPDAQTFRVPAGARYTSPGAIDVEGDASAASYFLAAGVLGGGPVRVPGVSRDSIQGDVIFADVLADQGAEIRYGGDFIEACAGTTPRGGTIDCATIPDAAMTLAVAALFAVAPTRLTNIGSWRVKETDRIAAMAAELGKLGARVASGSDWIEIAPPERFAPAAIDTYLDSGSLYRLVALKALRSGIALDDEPALANAAGTLEVDFGGGGVSLDGDDATEGIRREAVSAAASQVAVHAAVRRALLSRQQAFRQPPGLVAEGRDMGTVVFPDAAVKVFVT